MSHGEAYLPHDKGSGGAAFNRLASSQSRLPGRGLNRAVASRYVSRFFSSEPDASRTKFPQTTGNISFINFCGVKFFSGDHVQILEIKIYLFWDL